jgi:hypothetical protein
MFYFVVKNLRWLARVPGLPQFFDALLVAGTCVFRSSRVQAMEKLEREVLRLPGVRFKNHRFGGMEFVGKDGDELGHLHGNGLLDVPAGVEAAAALIASGRVRPHHVFPKSKWISFQLENEQDVQFAAELIKSKAVRESVNKPSLRD